MLPNRQANRGNAEEPKHGKLRLGPQAAGLPQNLQASGLRSQKSIPGFLLWFFVLLASRFSLHASLA
ncbi:MAG TPA: hypothetical protein VKC60_18205 [Opitutaceae bacterium]|nr:hypothetical protein [Opitutaceae bacterium]